ncbi:hypothetical protein B0H34DRAFT_746794 [Crassisporium funariophilum]|nr:hypothetical protein B0H34DRAFT_746794 [Crassisporium funariophilum]
MAQAATMGPPLSPRETRRSGRRSAPSVSASTSKSPDSDQPPRQKEGANRVASSTTSAGGRNKRLKQEDHEEALEERRNPTSSVASSGSVNGNNNGKARRKPKDKDKDKLSSSTNSGDPDVASTEGQPQDPVEEEEQGITRCVCGSAEDDPDAGEFMVQCETCKVWQHGLCMGYQSEDQVHDDDYYCEQCRPELHQELLKKLVKRPRQPSANSRQDPSTASRVSRSHSPSHLLKQPSKRRNTMNSRDAAFDESLKEIIEATAAEAATIQNTSVSEVGAPLPDADDAIPSSKKKRKRTEDDTTSKKRTRSASTVSDRQTGTAPPVDVPLPEKLPPQPPKSSARHKRGGRKVATIEVAVVEPEEVTGASLKRQGNNPRAKATNIIKRPPLSQSVSHGSAAAGVHEHGTRRNQAGGGQHVNSGVAESSRAYRNTHAYAVSQQSLFTSWNLPDYLSHLEEMLPTDIPQPLEVRSTTGAPGPRGESVERTMERGVKVKWPSKRMSVGDMNKRVRALVEWVGREQASALDRGRRREALEKALPEEPTNLSDTNDRTGDSGAHGGDMDVAMVLDEDTPIDQQSNKARLSFASQAMVESALDMSTSTMKMMEELMEELIGFQERFGPGVKTRDRERKVIPTS